MFSIDIFSAKEPLEPMKNIKNVEKKNDGQGDSVTLMPLLPVFEFEDEDGNVFVVDQQPSQVQEETDDSTTDPPVGLSPSCLASLVCG